MALPLMNFPRFTFAELNPFMTGYRQGVDTSNTMSDMISKYLAQQKSRAELPYAGPQAEATLNQTQAMAPYLQSQTGLNQKQFNWYDTNQKVENALKQAQASNFYTEAAKTKYMLNNPGLFGGDEAKNAALGEIYQKNNPSSSDNLYKKLAESKIAEQQGMANFYNSGGSQLGVGAKEVRNFQSQLMNEYGFTQDQALKAVNAYMSGKTSFDDGKPLPKPSALDQESMNRIVKYGSTTQNLNQQGAGQILDQLIDKGTQLMPGASRFAGLAGKGRQTADQIAASVGQGDPDYQDYLLFTRQIVPQLANQMILTEGARANNTQKAMMISVANPLTWDSNPQLALKNWRYLTDTFKNSVSKVVSQGVAERRQNMRDQSSMTSTSNLSDPLGLR